MTDAEKLGVALLGFASIGNQHHQSNMYWPALHQHAALRVLVATDEAAAPHARNQREAERLGVPYHAELDQVLADPAVHVVSICCALDRRAEVIARVAEAGKHMLVDKPLASTLADCARIERAVEDAGVACLPAYHYRFNAAVRSARAAVAAGSIGLPWAVQSEFIIAGGTAAWPLGELQNFGLYPVDAIRAILGLEVQSVYAASGAFFYDSDADDLSVLALTLEHGVIATTSIGRSPTRQHPNGYDGDRRLRIMGSHGTLVVDAAKPRLSVYDATPPMRPYGPPESLRALVDHLVACARGQARPELGPRDARAALEVTLAARVAARDNRVVHLPLAEDATV